ncbi:MAG: DUF2892 domain-containing protein [Alphaproteobacteria bacterium]
MTRNVGTLDRTLRIIIGVVLLGYAMKIGFPDTGWNWAGWIGVVPILTALVRVCPAYSILGIKT